MSDLAATPPAAERTLVCILGQTRAHELTWPSFEQYLLKPLKDPDLALCIGVDDTYHYNNNFYKNAKYIWTIREPGDYGQEFERIRQALGCAGGWQKLLDIGEHAHAFGGVAGLPGSGGISLVFRWLVGNKVLERGLLHQYDRFIITRSDFLYVAPHPCLEAIDPRYIWLPDGENYGGLADRHMVVSASDLAESLSTLGDILRYPDDWERELNSRRKHCRNIEGVLEIYFNKRGLLSRVRRFPYVMFLVRGENDPTRWAEGVPDPKLGLRIKYPTEYRLAERWKDHFRCNADWHRWARAGRSDAEIVGFESES
jgi:hypothetical protein